MMRENWIEGKLEDLLNYIQPTNYIVESTAYNDNYKTPVLTAGKTFILGYTDEENNVFATLPVIIFDDFTTSTKYVNFKFKVKSSAMKILAPSSEEVNVKYVYYHMQTIRHNVDTHKRYWISIFSKLNIAIAPLPEQRAIVAKIEESFSKLDSGIESLKKAKEQLEIYRQAVLKAAFEGKLTRKWREKNICTEMQNEWMRRKLGDVCDKVEKINKKNLDKHKQFFYIDIGSIDNEIYKIISHKVYKWEDAPSRAQQIIKIGDVLFSTVRTYLKNIAQVTDSIHNNQICSSGFTVIRGIEKLLDPKFIFYFTIYEGFLQPLNKLQTGSSYPAVRDKDVFEQIIPLPLLKEQNQIVQEIESRLSVCENIEANIEEALEKAEALRQSILKKAFEGKLLSKEVLEACRQEDDWEPAAELLKRIKEDNKEVN